MIARAQDGFSQPVLERRPAIYRTTAWVYDDYWEIDRSEMGVPSFRGMNDVLTEYDIADKDERKRVRSYWRAMYSQEVKDREARLEATKTAAGNG